MTAAHDSFVHLHAHTIYSALDGTVSARDAAKKVANDGQPALAITDHGTMSGIPDLYRACKAEGITPIYGIEAYMAFEDVRDHTPEWKAEQARKEAEQEGDGSHDDHHHHDHSGGCTECQGTSTSVPTDAVTLGSNMDADSGESDEKGRKQFYHLLMVAETQKGYENLAKLSSRSYREGFYRKPRIDWQMLEEHSEGLIATTSCLGSVVQQALLRGDYAEAIGHASRLKDIFEDGNFFVEMQDHGIQAQAELNPILVKIAKELDLPLVATNDFHYLDQADSVPQEAALALGTHTTLSDPKRFKFEGDTNHVKTAHEMRNGTFSAFGKSAIWESEDDSRYTVKAACDNTLLIAERVAEGGVHLPFDQGYHLPAFPESQKTKPEMNDTDYLRYKVIEGAKKKYGNGFNDAVRERIDYELTVIEQMGFSSYFLITADVCYANDRMGYYRGPGRGSAAGSIVAYALDITRIDPLHYDLPFERFLNPSRVSMPDIDLDFEQKARPYLYQYTQDLYGEDRVSQIVTFAGVKARSAIRDAARVLDLPDYDKVASKLCDLIPPDQAGKQASLAACLTTEAAEAEGAIGLSFYGLSERLRKLGEQDPNSHKVLDLAQSLSGLVRQPGRHAAAVVIADRDLDEVIPVLNVRDKGTDSGRSGIITQYAMKDVEALGLLKMDYLGLKNLDAIHSAVDLIRHNHDPEFVIEDIPLDDQATFSLLSSGRSVGVFQLEGEGMQSLLIESGPDKFDDIPTVVALYRPGPMEAGAHEMWARRKRGDEAITPLLPILESCEDILEPTLGLIAYQEQVMQIAQRVAGYDGSEADDLRKAMGKKIDKLMAEHEVKFVNGAVNNGHSREAGQDLFELLKPFADYGFSKNHAVPYGMIAYQTAYLKANYPAEFLAAMMDAFGGSKGKIGLLIRDAKSMGVPTVPPSVLHGEGKMRVMKPSDEYPKGAIVFGWGNITGIGDAKMDAITTAFSDKRASPLTFEEALLRLGPLPEKITSGLVRAGALDGFGADRGPILAAVPVAKSVYQAAQKRMGKAKQSEKLFGGSNGLRLEGIPSRIADVLREVSREELSSVTEASEGVPFLTPEERLRGEVELVGQFLTVDPFEMVKTSFRRHTDRMRQAGQELKAPEDMKDNERVDAVICAEQWNVREVKSGSNAGRSWAIVEGITLSGDPITVKFGARAFSEFSEQYPEWCEQSGAVIAVQGRADIRLIDGEEELVDIGLWASKFKVLKPESPQEADMMGFVPWAKSLIRHDAPEGSWKRTFLDLKGIEVGSDEITHALLQRRLYTLLRAKEVSQSSVRLGSSAPEGAATEAWLSEGFEVEWENPRPVVTENGKEISAASWKLEWKAEIYRAA